MSRTSRMLCALAIAAVAYAQDVAPTNDAPNPYQTIKGWYKLPEGRKMGSTSAVDIDRDGKSVWVVERCGANSCLDRATGQIKDVDPILKFDENGNLVKSFGKGMFIAPHGIYVDRQDNVWITDYQDNGPLPEGRGRGGRGGAGGGGGRAAAPTGPIGPRPGATKGNQVFKFSKDGKLLMTIGKPGGAAEPECCYAPDDVIVAPNGDIFVSEGHGAGNNIVFKFDKNGKEIKHWGKLGTGPGEFDQPHSLAFDSKGRLYVADRNNNRIQVFDQDGNFISEMKQFSRPSGIFIDKHDNLYSADSESESVSRNHNGWKRGMRIGNLKDGKVVAYIPDPDEHATGTSAAEGVAADAKGNIYGAEVGPQDVKKYVKK
ncbi:MAG TPA: peptidyl-alpha-hydroxyglycine alpha-amidating lyase family protein [Bryobacteraceae bacterium]|nr:peptidyl-alpha-hydroxyglycine alpha-amidating lyase family protein [Bryobacteraceae bacterium]